MTHTKERLIRQPLMRVGVDFFSTVLVDLNGKSGSVRSVHFSAAAPAIDNNSGTRVSLESWSKYFSAHRSKGIAHDPAFKSLLHSTLIDFKKFLDRHCLVSISWLVNNINIKSGNTTAPGGHWPRKEVWGCAALKTPGSRLFCSSQGSHFKQKGQFTRSPFEKIWKF